MTIWQALASLLVPAHFRDWYLSTAVQGCHVAFGALAYAIERDTVRDRVTLRRGLILAMCAVSAWEALSLAIYGGSWLDRWNNAAFMMGASHPPGRTSRIWESSRPVVRPCARPVRKPHALGVSEETKLYV